ncbi:DEAD/DEAH box helicase [Fusobacterium sp. MFO224]|uniref:DEAD/DEAH box helicase n=1 Tax=Fusobacterium sp. MFO224 TaxID=3378070 RepID=UPI0038542911
MKLKTEKEIYFMLIIDNDGDYIIPVSKEKKEITDFSDFQIENKNIEKLISLLKETKEDDFFVGWGEEKKELYFEQVSEIAEYLKNIENFVDENFNKILWSFEENNLKLILEEEKEEKLSSKLILNNKYSDFKILNEHLIFRKGIMYVFEELFLDTSLLDDLNIDIDKNDIEVFLSLANNYVNDIEINYLDYKIEKKSELKGIPQLVIDKISQDNSLYLKINILYSSISDEFIRKNNLEEIIIINNLEKKISKCKVNLDEINEFIDEIIKIIVKHQKNLGIRYGYFLDEDNLLIIQEKLAKEFVKKDLLQLAGKYKVVGTDKLKKYSIKVAKPKLVGKLKHSIDFLEGELELEIGEEKFSIADILSTLKKDSYIVLGDGTNAIINKKYIEKLEKVFKIDENKKVKISFFDLPIVDEMINDKILKTEINKRKDFFLGINNLESKKIRLPKINATLRKYQEYGCKWLAYLIKNNLGGCLADDMGLGKTLQAIVLINKIHMRPNKRTLVVMPKSLVYNWESEIKKFSSNLNTGIYYGSNRNLEEIMDSEVILTTYGTIRNDIEKLKKIKFDLVILDESQNIKNINAQTTKAVMLLNSKNRIALSGTPVENNLGELYSLFRFLNPSMFGTAEEFNRFYATPIHRDNDQEAINELRKKIYPFILRRIKKEVLKDLPDKIEKVVYIGMNPSQKKYYEERRMYYYNMVHENIKTKGFNKSQFYILQALNELRQITSCPETKNSSIVSSKKIVVIENIIEAVKNNHKVLVFANYINSIEGICKELEKNEIKYLSMTGATKDRHILVDKFQTDSKYKVFVMTLKTGGVGLNLTAADTIFIYDPWWNKTVENQAVDRAYRLGQDRTVFSYKMILKDTIEEKILKLQETKTQLVESLISDEGAAVKSLNEEDIEFILGS